MGDEEGNESCLSDWSWEDNKLFEIALASIDEENPNRWNEIASMIGGRKSAEDVKKHYEMLLQDLSIIESGSLDHELREEARCDDYRHFSWSDDDQRIFAQLRIEARREEEQRYSNGQFRPSSNL